MNLEERSLLELKAMIYDINREIAKLQQLGNLIVEEIEKRETEEDDQSEE